MMRILLSVVLVFGLVPTAAWSGGNDDCLQCHGERGLTMTKKGKTIQLEVDRSAFHTSAHGEMECVSCHEGFSASDIPHAKRIVPVKCSTCHSDEQFLRFSESLHGSTKKGGASITCSGCHGNHDIAKLSGQSSSQRQQFAVATCAKCHEQVNVRYQASDHAVALAAGVKGAPSCIDCHNVHDIQRPGSDSASTSRTHEAAMCLACHVDNADVKARVGPSAGFISSYEKSVHGKAMRDGKKAAAICTDCHGSHDMKKGANPASRVAKKNIAATCGVCHANILEQYRGSIHGTKLASGVEASATCTDCHGEHDILSPKDAASRVSAKNVSGQVCSPCHASVRLTQKFGLATDRYRSFEDSYHGLAGKAGNVEVANCASCHGVHDIKPSSDSTSRISPQHLVKTCGTCHPGANTNFTKGAVHVVATDRNEGILYLVSSGYIILIIVLIGGMAFHNAADFVTKSRRRLMERRGIIIRHHPGHRLYLRMALSERLQHATLLVSFLTLVVTGFALRFPDAWWVAPVRDVSPWMFFARGIIHRIAGVVMVLASLYHIYYLFFVPRGKQLLKDLLPVRKDITEAVGMLKYNLSLSTERPKLDRFSYIEKAEYWALIWGTAVMAATGAILWFDNTFLGILTKLWWDVARTVHYYEAWLATLAIVIWHFYFVMFNPDIYPINLAFWKGTLTEEEMEEEHPAELERLKKQQAAEARGE